MTKHDVMYLIIDELYPLSIRAEIRFYIEDFEATEKELEGVSVDRDTCTIMYYNLEEKHEELKRDVKRYFELRDKGSLVFGTDESVEMFRLRQKLSKVGTEQ